MLQRTKILLTAALFCVAPFNNIPVFAEAVELKGAGQAAKALMASKCKNNSNSSVAQTSAQPAKEQPDNQEVEKPVAAENAQKPQQIVSEGDCDGKNVEQVDLCDVSGTVCEDCGEIVLAGGVLPEFAEVGGPIGDFSISPLYALAGIPLGLLAILRRSNDNNRQGLPLTPLISINVPEGIITPVIPNQPASPVPEPLPLLLFGAGLSAIATVTRRRRRSRLDSANAVATAEDVVGE
ncbi:MAG: PEP-CTERM sorting domain-containing protein [Pyrinomonadaceae bacterium]